MKKKSIREKTKENHNFFKQIQIFFHPTQKLLKFQSETFYGMVIQLLQLLLHICIFVCPFVFKYIGRCRREVLSLGVAETMCSLLCGRNIIIGRFEIVRYAYVFAKSRMPFVAIIAKNRTLRQFAGFAITCDTLSSTTVLFCFILCTGVERLLAVCCKISPA